MRISDWSSDVCSSDLQLGSRCSGRGQSENDSSGGGCPQKRDVSDSAPVTAAHYARRWLCQRSRPDSTINNMPNALGASTWSPKNAQPMTAASRSRSEEHTSELQSLMRISYAVFCL